jgi:pSer/pThr/pTyr-binding forkhead associated (FHA) protein
MKNRFTIGRDQSADIPIADSSVSRLHAEITVLEGGKLFLTDCRSSNGTFVIRGGSERRISQETVAPGDIVKLGSVELAVADLLAVTQQKAGAAAAPAGERPKSRDFPKGAKLVRCDCGAVKTHQGRCPSCGQ